jgi:phosphoglycolate phosphatase-like HAD superfamily hydrolase
MNTASQPVRPEDKIRLIITGIEGQFIDSEWIHFNKTFETVREFVRENRLETAYGNFFTGDNKKSFWQSDLIGIGDVAIFERLRDYHSKLRTGVGFMSKEAYLEKTQAYYEEEQEDATPAPGLVEFLDEARKRGIRIIVATHAPGLLAAKQVELSGAQGFVKFDDIYAGERLSTGYGRKPDCYPNLVAIVNYQLDNCGAKGVKPSEVLIIDSDKYTRPVAALYRTASISQRSDEEFIKGPPDNITSWDALRKEISRPNSEPVPQAFKHER